MGSQLAVAPLRRLRRADPRSELLSDRLSKGPECHRPRHCRNLPPRHHPPHRMARRRSPHAPRIDRRSRRGDWSGGALFKSLESFLCRGGLNHSLFLLKLRIQSQAHPLTRKGEMGTEI